MGSHEHMVPVSCIKSYTYQSSPVDAWTKWQMEFFLNGPNDYEVMASHRTNNPLPK